MLFAVELYRGSYRVVGGGGGGGEGGGGGGGGGESLARFTNRKKQRITDHGYQNFMYRFVPLVKFAEK